MVCESLRGKDCLKMDIALTDQPGEFGDRSVQHRETLAPLLKILDLDQRQNNKRCVHPIFRSALSLMLYNILLTESAAVNLPESSVELQMVKCQYATSVCNCLKVFRRPHNR